MLCTYVHVKTCSLNNYCFLNIQLFYEVHKIKAVARLPAPDTTLKYIMLMELQLSAGKSGYYVIV